MVQVQHVSIREQRGAGKWSFAVFGGSRVVLSERSTTPGLETAARSAGFDHVLTVPCTILHQWYRPAPTIMTIYLSREEEGVGLAVGLLAAGCRPLLMIKNSGLGNCVNALGSLAVAYRVPLVVVVSLRGDEFDDNPVQAPMGAATVPLVRALGCEYTRIEREAEVARMLAESDRRARNARRPEFLLLPRREALC
jgi:sulfopyruvate decarboxylase subunit alpha